MITIGALLRESHLPDSPTEYLDLELLLAAALDKPRSYLYTWPNELVDEKALKLFAHYLQRRKTGEPIAYILGTQGFWSLDLKVAKHTLIPRPDTELLVEIGLTKLAEDKSQMVLDLGTGTGAIGLAIASERPLSKVVGVDFIDEAVHLAVQNKQALQLKNIEFLQSDWFNCLDAQPFNLILSNPPYIASNDPHLIQGDVKFEPITALVAGKDGLDDIRLIIDQAPRYLLVEGWLFLEHGYNQAEMVTNLLLTRGFKEVTTHRDLGGNDRVTGGQWLCC